MSLLVRGKRGQEGEQVIMNTSIIHPTTAYTSAQTETFEVQVTQLWGGNAIAQKHASDGAVSFAVGDSDLEIARWQSGELVVVPPPNATMFVDRLMQTPEP